MDLATPKLVSFVIPVHIYMSSIFKRILALCILLGGLFFASNPAWAQWSVHDRLVFDQTKLILEQMKPVNTVTVTALGSNTYTLTDLRAMSTNNSKGSFTYAASGMVNHFDPKHTLCSNGGKGLLSNANQAGVEAFNSCKSAQQLTVAMYDLTNLYHDRMAEYGKKIKDLSYLSPATLGEASTLKYQLAYLDALQQNEMHIYRTQMDLHKSKYDIFKQRQAEAEKFAVYGKANKDAGDLAKQAAIILASRVLMPR